nr:hypothetical protein [Novosphingobium panipatense]
METISAAKPVLTLAAPLPAPFLALSMHDCFIELPLMSLCDFQSLGGKLAQAGGEGVALWEARGLAIELKFLGKAVRGNF